MTTLSRRQALLIGGGVAVVAGGGVGARYLLRKRYAPSPYDDLLAQVEDRDAAAQIGEAVLAEDDAFEPEAADLSLRQRLAGRSFSAVSVDDAGAARLIEAGGWVLPETLGLICALAAKAAA